MKHLYQNDDGEVVAADTANQAALHYHGMAGEKPVYDWRQLDDDKRVTITDVDEPGQPAQSKTAAEWASECNCPMQVSTTYC